MRWSDIRGAICIAVKDMKTYYLKPPAISWGIVFPVSWIAAFYLRNPRDFTELVPGLVAMTILFSTTAAEAVVINFELRMGSLERLLLAPISPKAVLLGKVLGGTAFGFIMSAVVAAGASAILGLRPNVFYLLVIMSLSLVVFSSLGALVCVMVREVFEAQTLLNLPRFLMVFVSGVVYPVSGMPVVLQFFSRIMPLTYVVEGLRSAFGAARPATIMVDVGMLTVFLVLYLIPAMRLLERKFE